MACTSLKNGEFQRPYFTADLLLYHFLKVSARSAEHCVTELIEFIASCGNILTVFISYALAYNNDYRVIFLKFCLNITDKFVYRKSNLGNIDKVRSDILAVSCKHARSGEPTCVSAHSLNNMNGFNAVNSRVIGYISYRKGNIFCRTGKSGRMVDSHKVVIYSLWDTHYFNIYIIFCNIS